MLLLYRTFFCSNCKISWLYIPLCFYYIKQSFSVILKSTNFTFHYASTISLASPSNTMSVSSLHSTMLLLYLIGLRDKETGREYLYIPLCFYYIITPKKPPIKESIFTFHYASTISLCSFLSICNLFPFTFHYASTISVNVDQSVEQPSNFTFHYASTISVKFTTTIDEDLPLHSTMLLLYPVALDAP